MKQQSPMLRLWELGAEQHGSLIRAILSAVAGVLCGMAPLLCRRPDHSRSAYPETQNSRST